MIAEICIPVWANSPGEAVEVFEKGLDKAFRDYEIADRIHVIDERDDRIRVIDEKGNWHYAEDLD